GKGLPPDVDEEHLFDPYVTTRKGGTGLGLAMVRRVMDEHDGTATIRRRPQGGAAVELMLPAPLAAAAASPATAQNRPNQEPAKQKDGQEDGQEGKNGG